MGIQEGTSRDFEIVIKEGLVRRSGPTEYPVQVRSPAGPAEGGFVLPFSTKKIEEALEKFREGIPSGRYQRKVTRSVKSDVLSPQRFGDALFRGLFSSDVLARYRQSLSTLARNVAVDKRLYIKLNIAPQELTRLPWELLHDTERDEFLSFGQDTPVIRFVDRKPKQYISYDPPIRVLLVGANPSGTPILNLQREAKVIEEALDTLRKQDKAQILYLFGATVEELRSKIRGLRPPHVIHFMGHGQVNRLLFEDQEGRGTPLSDSSLGIILRNAPSLRLVVLNACETARPSDSEARLGIAYELARRGVPAVVAMQFEISDEAAPTFAGEFYRVLAEGLGIDDAVLWGRIAVQNRFFDRMEWATPVLYMQAQEGRIFDDLLGKGPRVDAVVDELSAIQKERTEILWKQLRIHERSLWRLETQKAQFGLMAPPYFDHAIDEEKAAIKQIRDELDRLGLHKKVTEPQVRPVAGIPDTDQEDAAVDVDRRLADIAVTERKPSDPRLLERLQTYYEQGLRHFDKGEWDQALTFLEDVQRLAPGYKDAQRLVRTACEELRKQKTERRTREKLAALYRQVLTHCDEKRWQAAVDLFEEILRIDPHYRDAPTQAEKAKEALAQQLAEERTRSKLKALYRRAQEYLASEDWGQAIGPLEQIVQIDRGYADASVQLAEARRQRQLAELYGKGEKSFAAQDWEQAVANFGAASAIDKSYRDVEAKLEQARQQRRWDALYQEGLEYLIAERWNEAVEALREVQPDQKRRKDAKVARLYAEGRQHATQERWELALASFEKVVEENPLYRDAAEQLKKARQQKRFHDLYTEGVKRMEAQDWQQAIRAFEQVTREAPNYRDVQRRLEMTKVEAELAERYASGKRFFDLGRWNEAIQDFQSIVKVRSDYPNVQRMLDKATREKELADLYAEGMRCLDKGLWQEAIDAFEKIVRIVPDYRDAVRKLDDARKKKLLISAYEQGKACYEQGDWTGAIYHLEQVMHCEDKGYRNAAVLLAEARQEEQLAQLYQKGLDYLAADNWDKALFSFEQVVELKQNYRDVTTKVAEARRQKWLAGTYAEAERLIEAEQWEDAAIKFQQILGKAPDYRQAPALLAEAQRQDRLDILYAAANQVYEQERWTEAIEKFQQILAEDAKYRDVEKKVAEAQWQQGLKENYERGMACFGRDDWEGAISALEAVVEKDDNYEDAFVKLSEARRQQTLARHYAEGEWCMAEERWAEAIAAFRKVVGIDSHYLDIEDRLEEANRQKRLAELYATGEKHLASKEWGQAIEWFRRVQEMDEGYRDASEKLKEAAHERNLESLYGQGMRFFKAGKWSEALESWRELVASEPNYCDVAARIEEARQREIDRLRQEADKCSRKGELEKEVEIRERIEQLKAAS